MYPSPLKAELPESRLRWMLVLSLLLHAVLLAAFFGSPPDTSKRVYFSPVYSVSLVDLPPGPPGPKTSASGQTATRLWKGPAALETETKAAPARSHNIITVSKHEEFQYAPQTKKEQRSHEGPQRPATPSGEGAREDERSAGTQSGSNTGEAITQTGGGGGGGGAADLRFSQYYQAIWQRIQQAWVLPPYDKKGRLEAIVVITVNREGKILGFDFEKRSGDENLDNSVVRAIKKADPLPPFPPDLRESVLEIGIRFIPEEKQF